MAISRSALSVRPLGDQAYRKSKTGLTKYCAFLTLHPCQSVLPAVSAMAFHTGKVFFLLSFYAFFCGFQYEAVHI